MDAYEYKKQSKLLESFFFLGLNHVPSIGHLPKQSRSFCLWRIQTCCGQHILLCIHLQDLVTDLMDKPRVKYIGRQMQQCVTNKDLKKCMCSARLQTTNSVFQDILSSSHRSCANSSNHLSRALD